MNRPDEHRKIENYFITCFYSALTKTMCDTVNI